MTTACACEQDSSGTPRRTFALESELCEVLVAGIPEMLGWSRTGTMMSEIQVGAVIPDLVIVDRVVDQWRPISLTGFDSWIVADLLRARSRRVTTLSRRLFARPEKTMRAVERLERLGLLDRASGAAFSLRACFPRDAEVVAVEAKLYRWREAVDQATEYLGFANRSYVALPKETVEATRGLLAACRSRGLGAIAVSEAGIEVVRTAPLHQPRSPGWVWLVARALERQGRATSSTPLRAPSATRAGVRATSGDESRPATTP